MPSVPKTIDEVLHALDNIIDQCIMMDSYLAIFAWVYRRTTAEIRDKIRNGMFDDNVRMEKLDVLFANLYIRAFWDYKDGKDVSRSWEVAFERQFDKLAVIQHLLLGMNAHINLDLAIAASNVMKGKQIGDIERDFRLVNDVLSGITNEVQEKLSRVSPLLFLLDWIGQRNDEKLADFSIVIAREQSWKMAMEIWLQDEGNQNHRIDKLDHSVAAFGKQLAEPQIGILRAALTLISTFESRNKEKIINAMRKF